MKVNEVPEKIYKTITYLDERKNGVVKWKDKPVAGAENIEYTRTDAFIEKVYKFFEVHLCEYIDVKNANCDTFVNVDGDKLREDFKNYMKEE